MKQPTPERRQILDLLADGCSRSPSTIATQINKKPSNTNKLLLGLERQGLVVRIGYGLYALPATETLTAEPPQVTTDAGVYILKNGPYYKIGKSRNVGWRVEQLRTALPQETIHVHTVVTDDPDGLERLLHQTYAPKRVRGEWFELDLFDVDELCHL